MKNSALPSVVVLDMGFAGYGVLRSLKKYQIPLIGFYGSKLLPERYTRLCDRKIYYKNSNDLLNKLIELSESLASTPVLILTTDYYVEFYVQNRQVLSTRFLYHMPDDEIVNLLMDKNKFSLYANENNILIPKSYEITQEQDVIGSSHVLRFPVIVKPYKRTLEWSNAGFDKAYILEDLESLQTFYKKVSEVEARLIVQEFITGNDDQVFYCLTYFSEESECKLAFTGKKIRQWPVGTGSTATTVPVTNDIIKVETIRIFKQLKYKGFGSIEYKFDQRDNQYYLIEPTVGRLNQQEFVATLSGFNIPLAGYCDITGVSIEPTEQCQSNIVYIDEVAETYSIYTHLKRKIITVPQWLNSLKGKRYYRFSNQMDIGVLFGLLIKLFFRMLSFR